MIVKELTGTCKRHDKLLGEAAAVMLRKPQAATGTKSLLKVLRRQADVDSR
jgi:hypothetical protein